MNSHRSLFAIACRAAALSFLMVGPASLLQAQQGASSAPTVQAPLLLASESASASIASAAYSSSSSSSDSDAAADSGTRFNLLDSSQPPPRRYGRPSYAGGNTNADGSRKYTFMGGFGFTLPVGDTHVYETPSWGFQFGGGRNYNKIFGLIAQFDYDHFGLQNNTINNQSYLYNLGCSSASLNAGTCGVSYLGGNNHVWSFTLNPTFTLPTSGTWGAYTVVGAGFYHKVTNFTEPQTGYYFDPYFGTVPYQANQNIDHYTSNAFGVNGGFGITYKFSQFASERLYMEVRYVLILNQQRYGLTVADSQTAPYGSTSNPGGTYNGTNYYPQNSNRTTYIPVKFGLRF